MNRNHNKYKHKSKEYSLAKNIIRAMYFVFILFSLNSFAQQNISINDTIFPFGKIHTDFCHIIDADSFLIFEGKSLKKFFIKADNQGVILAKKYLNGISNKDAITNIIYKNGSLYYLVGEHNHYDLRVYDSNFNFLWSQGYKHNFADYDMFTDFINTPDGGFLVAGYFGYVPSPYPNYLPYLMKIGYMGNIQWVSILSNHPNEKINKIILTEDLGILAITSDTGSSIIKLNALGQTQWEKSKPNPLSYKKGFTVSHEANNDFIICGPWKYSQLNMNSKFGINIFKINGLTGNILWDTNYIPADDIEVEMSFGINVTKSNIFIAATTIADVYFPNQLVHKKYGTVFKFSSTGSLYGMQKLYFGDTNNLNNSILHEILFLDSGKYIGVGSFEEMNNFPGWFFKTGPNGIMVVKNHHSSGLNAIIIFPNPAVNQCEIRLEDNIPGEKVLTVFSSDGRLIERTSLTENKLYLNTSDYPSGMYFITVETKTGNRFFGRFVKI